MTNTPYTLITILLPILVFAAFYAWLSYQEAKMIKNERDQRGRDRWIEFFNEE